MRKKISGLIYTLVVIFIFACVQNPSAVPINFGKDQCTFCTMTISNPKFGAELITDKGRVLKYDATECLVNHLRQGDTKYKKLYAVPYDQPKQLEEVDTLHFLISPDVRSPMGADLSAYSDSNQLDSKYHPELMTWEELLKELE